MTTPRARYSGEHWARRPASEPGLADYLEQNRRPYNATKIALFERLLGDGLRDRQVLDYGGGAGFMAVRCAEQGASVTLVDAEASALETARLLARKRGVPDRVDTICAESFPTELTARRFDVVIVKDVIEHIPDDQALLHELARCQGPGGRLLLSTQNSWSLNYLLEGSYRRWWCGEHDWCGWDPTHLRFYTPRSLKRLLDRAGYVPKRWRGVFVIPYNILSWLFLLKREIVLTGLRKFDLMFGGTFPFSRCGWNVVVLAERAASGPV